MAVGVVFLAQQGGYTVDAKNTAMCKPLDTNTVCNVAYISHFEARVTRTSDNKTCAFKGSLSRNKKPMVNLITGTCAFNGKIDNNAAPNLIKVWLQ